jgi:two-component system response regulator HydG
VRGVTVDAMERLVRHPWPGNVRQLFNVLEDAFMSCSTLHITRDDLALVSPLSPPAAVEGNSTADGVQTYQEGERAMVARALASTGGNKLLASRRLGISRKKLYSMLAKYALSVLLLCYLPSL